MQGRRRPFVPKAVDAHLGLMESAFGRLSCRRPIMRRAREGAYARRCREAGGGGALRMRPPSPVSLRPQTLSLPLVGQIDVGSSCGSCERGALRDCMARSNASDRRAVPCSLGARHRVVALLCCRTVRCRGARGRAARGVPEAQGERSCAGVGRQGLPPSWCVRVPSGTRSWLLARGASVKGSPRAWG